MGIKRFLAALVVTAGLAAPAAAAPLEAYGKLPSIEAVALSPNGKQVAIIATNGEQRVIAVQDLESKAFTLRAGAGTLKVRGLRWVGDNDLVVVTTVTASPMDVLTTKRDWMMAFGVDIPSRKITPLMRNGDRAMNIVLDLPVVQTYKGEPTAFAKGISFDEQGRGRLSLFRINMSNGEATLVESGVETTRDWVVGADGQALGQDVYDATSGHWILRLKDGGAWRDVQTATALQDRPYTIGLGRDGKSVVYASRETGAWALYEVRPDGGKAGAPVPVLDDLAPMMDPRDGRVVGQVALVGDEHRYNFFDANDARVWSAVMGAFPGASVKLSSWSADHARIVLRVDSPDEGPAYALVDLATRKATWLGAEYDGVKAADIAPKKALRFKARDGLELTGYVTLPKGRTASALPLVVLPHDGPSERDRPGFDWFAQALASRGYAVLQVNFRGSDGLGGALLSAGYGQWGRKMQSDLADGVQHLAAQGTIDPKRVCIVGEGYGGYAALAGATLDQGVYRCAVSVAGISDLRKQVVYARTRGGVGYQRFWTRFLGAEDAGDPLLAAYSPANLAAKASIPVLLIHGRDDVVVPLEQSQLMANALQKAGKPVELVVQKGGDHDLTLGETRLGMLTSTVAFLEKNNPPN